MNSTLSRMLLTRTFARMAPRGEATSTRSPSPMPCSVASPADISTHTSGAAACSCGARPVLVRVWKWNSVRPVMRENGYSSLGASWGSRYSAALRTALASGFIARYSV